jgi:hypothetical protein
MRAICDRSLAFVKNCRCWRRMLSAQLIRDHMTRLRTNGWGRSSGEVDGICGISAVARSPQTKTTAHAEITSHRPRQPESALTKSTRTTHCKNTSNFQASNIFTSHVPALHAIAAHRIARALMALPPNRQEGCGRRPRLNRKCLGKQGLDEFAFYKFSVFQK